MNKITRNTLLTLAALAVAGFGTKAHAAPTVQDYEQALRSHPESGLKFQQLCFSMGAQRFQGVDHLAWLLSLIHI